MSGAPAWAISAILVPAPGLKASNHFFVEGSRDSPPMNSLNLPAWASSHSLARAADSGAGPYSIESKISRTPAAMGLVYLRALTNHLRCLKSAIKLAHSQNQN